MKFLYGKKMYNKRYEYMAKECKDKSILDVGCADCHLADYFPILSLIISLPQR